jgi:hypothetical protein
MCKLKCIGLGLVLWLMMVCFLTEPVLAGKPWIEDPPGPQNDVHGPNPGIAPDDGNAGDQAAIAGDPWGEDAPRADGKQPFKPDPQLAPDNGGDPLIRTMFYTWMQVIK